MMRKQKDKKQREEQGRLEGRDESGVKATCLGTKRDFFLIIMFPGMSQDLDQ